MRVGDPPTHSKFISKQVILLDQNCPGILCLALRTLQKEPTSDSQSQFSMSKIIRIFLIFFKNKGLGAHFL